MALFYANFALGFLAFLCHSGNGEIIRFEAVQNNQTIFKKVPNFLCSLRFGRHVLKIQDNIN